MESDSHRVIEAPSEINHSYASIRVTRSRLQKGLIALPQSLLHLFPKTNAMVQVLLDDSDSPQPKKYSHVAGTTKESRIGGMARWFEERGVRDGEELVIQLIDRERLLYRVSTHREFVATVKRHQRGLERATTVATARSHLDSLRRWINPVGMAVPLGEYHRLAERSFAEYRGMAHRVGRGERESTPPHLKALLGDIYGGRCQVCEFTFLKRDGSPYFEIHHLFPTKGHHPKNLVTSCANCHRQFEYATTGLHLDKQAWLVAVTFNSVRHVVYQALLDVRLAPPVKRVHET